MTWQSEDAAPDETLDEAISNPRFLTNAEHADYQRRQEDRRADAEEQRFLDEQFAQEQACPTYTAECVICGFLVSTSVDPARHDVTCRTCEQGWAQIPHAVKAMPNP